MAYAPHHGQRDPAVESTRALASRVIKHLQQRNAGPSRGQTVALNHIRSILNPPTARGVHFPGGGVLPPNPFNAAQNVPDWEENTSGDPFLANPVGHQAESQGAPMGFLGPPTPMPMGGGMGGGRGENIPRPNFQMRGGENFAPRPPGFQGGGDFLPQSNFFQRGGAEQVGPGHHTMPHDAVDLGGGILYSPTLGYIRSGGGINTGNARPGGGAGPGNSPY